jgi:FAS-associated factor 2
MSTDGTLSEQQILRSFQEITQVSDEYLALQILQQNGWNLERALSSFVQGGLGDSESDDEYDLPPASDNSYQNQPASSNPNPPPSNSSSSSSGAARSNNRTPMVGSNMREVINPQTQQQADGGGSLLDLLFVPLKWLFQARPTSINPAQDAQGFIEDFRSNYGPNHPAFHNGSYQSAVNAAFSSTKFVLVYLHSPIHEDTDRFCQEVLTAPSFVQLCNEQVVIWGGRIWDAEAYGLSTQLNAAAFPFLALLVPQSGRVVQIADRVQGFTDAAQLTTRLREAMGVFSAVVTRQREEQRRRDESTLLREQQNREYQEALEAEHREAERRRREEEEKIAAEEKKRAEEEEAAAIALSIKLTREDTIRKLRTAFNAEAEPKPAPDVATIRFQLPRAKKLTRNFFKFDKVQVRPLSPRPHSLRSPPNEHRLSQQIQQKLNEYLKLHFADEGDLTTNFAMFIPHPRTEIANMEQTVEEAVRTFHPPPCICLLVLTSCMCVYIGASSTWNVVCARFGHVKPRDSGRWALVSVMSIRDICSYSPSTA